MRNHQKDFALICNLQLKEIEKDCPLCMSSLMTLSKIILIRFYRKVQIIFFKCNINFILLFFFFLKKEYFALKSYEDVDEIMENDSLLTPECQKKNLRDHINCGAKDCE